MSDPLADTARSEVPALLARIADLEHGQAERDSRFRVLTESSFDLLCEIDEQSRFYYVSPNYLEVLGYRPDELVGTNALEIVHPDDRDATAEEISRAFSTGWGKRSLRVRHRSGAWRWFECAGKLYETTSGQRRALVVSRDVTDRVAAEDQLRESEERFRAIAEVNPVPILISRISDGLILYANQRLAETLGVDRAALIGQTTASFYDKPSDRAALMQTLSEQGQVNDYELKARRADGSTLWLFVSNRRIAYQGEAAALTGILDITQLKEAEIKLRRERTLLQQMLDLQERDRQLVAYEIHDGLVQHMTGALMFLQSYQHAERNSEPDRGKLNTALSLVQEAVQEARRLINGLRPPILDEGGVVPAIAHLIADLSQRTGLRIRFEHSLPAGRLSPPLENTIYRIVQEALTNVHRHSKAKEAKVTLVAEGGKLEIVVRDSGVGFELSEVPPTRFGLTGLLERARVFGGLAHIDTAPRRGTTIQVVLPLDEAARAEHNEP